MDEHSGLTKQGFEHVRAVVGRLSAQMGGAVNPGVHVGGAVNPGATVRSAVERGIPGSDMGTWRSPSGQVHRSRKHSKVATKQH